MRHSHYGRDNNNNNINCYTNNAKVVYFDNENNDTHSGGV
jgi:hypothetical protein